MIFLPFLTCFFFFFLGNSFIQNFRLKLNSVYVRHSHFYNCNLSVYRTFGNLIWRNVKFLRFFMALIILVPAVTSLNKFQNSLANFHNESKENLQKLCNFQGSNKAEQYSENCKNFSNLLILFYYKNRLSYIYKAYMASKF